jgi:HD superfamily phosphohydrolase
LHKDGGFRRDALSELVHLLQIRYSLTERVYYHHAKVVAGAMVSRALELALQSGTFQRSQLYTLRDDSLLFQLWQLRDRVDGLVDVLEDLDRRRLYKRVYLLTLEGLSRPGVSRTQRDQLSAQFHTDLARRRSVEQQIADRLGIPVAHVILYCPSPNMQLKEADVPVEVADGEIRPLATLGHPDVEALKEKHRGLWRFYVLVRRDELISAGKASEICEELIGHPNQLVSQKTGKLAFR